MATYTPKNLIGPSAAITSSVTAYSSATNNCTPVVRTILCTTSAASLTLTVAFGADAAGTRVINAVALTQAVPYVLNGWLISLTNNAHAIDVTGTGTGTQQLCNISGYEFA